MDRQGFQRRLLGGAAAIALLTAGTAANAQDVSFNIAPQSLASALNQFGAQSDTAVLVRPDLAATKTTRGVTGAASAEMALNTLLEGTGLGWRRDGDTFLIVRADQAPQGGSAAGGGATVEALIVTAQKREEDIQDVPIAISAFTQEDLTRSQVAGGPDLMTQVPNMTFTKTNFSSYSIQIRGIGTQAISATTDPAVAVAFNNTPFVRNRFFEQEFYDLERVEVLRGPQGTLYGRNATAGVVNIISAKPKLSYEAKLSGDVANYNSTRLEGMVNIPLVEDVVALRLAGAWTKREGYVTNQLTGSQIDGRDLWSARASLRIQPADRWRLDLIYEHFEEDDDRLRSGKQLCKKDPGPDELGGVLIPESGLGSGGAFGARTYLSQGCLPASLYSEESFQTPNGFALPFYGPIANIGAPTDRFVDPYVSTVQSWDLRVIESTRDPAYRAKADAVQIQYSYDLTDSLTLTSETAYSYDKLFSTQDYNRFNTKPGAFVTTNGSGPNDQVIRGVLSPEGIFCDPQLGCSDRLVLADLSTAESQQFSQELRLSSDFDGPANFSLGANFLRYDTEDKYYVFINSLSLLAAHPWSIGLDVPYVPGVTDNFDCLASKAPPDTNSSYQVQECVYIDPNPIESLNDRGRNYFLSRNPYRLISYAVFGEMYYEVAPDLKVTGGLRWTVDKKRAPRIPSWLLASHSYGDYPVVEIVDQEWREPTGRLAIDWQPDFAFTDETLLYASYAHGYKAGGANPPTPVYSTYGDAGGSEAVDVLTGHAKIFDAEYVDAFELGSKNTLMDGQLTLNLASFYYDYEGYQISQILDRSALNSNFDAEVWGVELEADWRPLENLRLGLKIGYQDTRVADGEEAIDLVDRTAGNPDWMVLRPFPTIPSNCIVPTYFLEHVFQTTAGGTFLQTASGPCVNAYYLNLDPRTFLPYVENPTATSGGTPLIGYPGFDPTTAPNGGAGFAKDLSGNELPNAPHFTTTLTADYTVPLANEWLMTLHADYYRQSEAWTRIFNFDPYDRLKPYQNVNLAAIFTNEDRGWNVMAYVKNVFDTDAITGAFLNSDDTGLTTNVFLLEPRLYGLRVTKNWSGGPLLGSFGDRRDGPYPFTIELSGGVSRTDAENQVFEPEWLDIFPTEVGFPLGVQNGDLDWGDERAARFTYRPGVGPWQISAAVRYGRSNAHDTQINQGEAPYVCLVGNTACLVAPNHIFGAAFPWGSDEVRDQERREIVDLTVGRDVGLGTWGNGSSIVSAGLRYASFESSTEIDIYGAPDHYLPPMNASKYIRHWHDYTEQVEQHREFEGAGPILSWEAFAKLAGDDQRGMIGLDWELTGGVLFGRQSATVVGETTEYYQVGFGPEAPKVITDTNQFERSEARSVTVPVASASLGLSYSIDRVKVGAGYRFERYFDVIDGGIKERRRYDRTIDGPYFKLSVGFGG